MSALRPIPLVFAALVLAACGSDPGAEPAAGLDGAGVAPDPACPAGSRPTSGTSTCEPVGTGAVPEGFVADAWGFHADLPTAPCTGATIALLGSSTCQPIDDCSAAFPPANATIVVRKGAAPYADRPDLAVVATLDEALAKVVIGANIAIDEGEFASASAFTSSVHFIGRCAEKTALRGADFAAKIEGARKISFQSLSFVGSSKASLLVNSKAVVTLDRVWVHGDHNGMQVGNGASFTAKRTVFEGPATTNNPNAPTAGLYAIYGGLLSLDQVEVRGYQLALQAESVGTQLTVSKSVVHEQVALDADPSALAQIGAFEGALVTIENSHVESAPGRIALVGAERLDGVGIPTDAHPATMKAKDSTLVHAVLPRDVGSAIDVVSGAALELENVTLRHESYAGVSGSEGAAITIRQSVVQGAASPSTPRIALVGLTSSKFVIDASALVAATEVALMLNGASTATVTGSLVTGTREVGVFDPTVFLGAGQAIAVARDGHVKLSDSALTDNEGTSLFVREGTAELDGVVVAGTHPSKIGLLGRAITAIDAVVAVRTSTLTKNEVALAIRGGRALLRESAVTDHADAIQIDGMTFVQTDAPLDAADDMQVLAARTRFARNTRLVTTRSLTGE